VWDSEHDAREFARSMGRWIDAGDGFAAVLPVEGTSVRVLFASEGATLASLEAAA